MTSSKKHFEEFKDHTLLKHTILEAYVAAWAFKLLQWRGRGDSVFFVDGFAGAGKDAAGKPGSPVIACRIAQDVRGALGKKQGLERARMKIVAVESDARRFASLERTIQPFAEIESDTVFALRGTMSERFEEVAKITGGAPTLYFLDPFGVKGLQASLYPKMLAGANNEILALFSDLGALRLRGVVHAGTKLEHEIRTLRNSPSLFPENDRAVEAALAAEDARKQSYRSLYGRKVAKAITDALGDSSWEEDLRGMGSDEAREELIIRFARKLIDSGARFVHVLPMRGRTGGHKYCLIHASKSVKGFTTMKEAVSTSLGKPRLAQEMRELIREDLRVPIESIVQSLEERFRGSEVRWSGQKGEDAGTVRRFLLDETDVFDFQCSDVKETLSKRGWLTRKGVDTVSFPKE